MKREEIFLSTKLPSSEYKEAKKAIDDTLIRLGVSYIDLLFLHQPSGDYMGAYQAMEEAKKEGKVRSLELSNFEGKDLDKVLSSVSVPPAVSQVEAHPYYLETALREKIADKNIHLIAWYPLGHGDKSLLNKKIFLDPVNKYPKSPAQVILRWHTEMGTIIIPASRKEEHIKSNADIFDFALNERDEGDYIVR